MDFDFDKVKEIFNVEMEDTPRSLTQKLNDFILENKVLKKKLAEAIKDAQHYQELNKKQEKKIEIYFNLLKDNKLIY